MVAGCGCYDLVVFGHACLERCPAIPVTRCVAGCQCEACTLAASIRRARAEADAEWRQRYQETVGRTMRNYASRPG